MKKFLKREGWCLLGVLDIGASFLIGWFVWKAFPLFHQVYRTPEILGFTFAFLNVIREISKLKHPVS